VSCDELYIDKKIIEFVIFEKIAEEFKIQFSITFRDETDT